MSELKSGTEYIVPIGSDEREFPRFRVYEQAVEHAAAYGIGSDRVITYDALYRPGDHTAPDVHDVGLALRMARESLERCEGKNIHSHGQMMTAAAELDYVLRQLVVSLDTERGEQQ